MKFKNHPRILFFTKSSKPSKEEEKKASELGNNVVFRNSYYAESGNSSELEKCDGVAGSVPKAYSAKPKAEDVIAKFEKDRKLYFSNENASEKPFPSK